MNGSGEINSYLNKLPHITEVGRLARLSSAIALKTEENRHHSACWRLQPTKLELEGQLHSNQRSNPCLLGISSISGRTSYRKISWSIEAARYGFRRFQSLWNLIGISAAALPRCLSTFKAIQSQWQPISRLWDFMRSCGKASVRLLNRGPEDVGFESWFNLKSIPGAF